jgi:hypothetical protein
MTIIQGLIASISGTAGGGGPPPDTNHTFGYYVNPPNWVAFGGLQSSGTTSATVNASYTFPDNSTGSVLEFTGNEYYLSPNLGIGGAWANGTAMAVNIWFYPTANGIQIISECDRQDFSSYHYSMLEINSSGNVLAKFWPAPFITSDNTVNLNAWNHIYFATDWQGGKYFALNNTTTNWQEYTTRQGPGTTSEYFIIGLSDPTNMGNSNRFQGKIGYIEISDYTAPSAYDTYKARFGLP